jgi:putative spermidine/putrescine transport system permease protein
VELTPPADVQQPHKPAPPTGRVAAAVVAPRPGFRIDADLRQAGRRALLIVPGLLFILVMFLYPLGSLVATSVRGDHGLTVAHYQRIWTVPAYTRILGNTLLMAMVVTGLCLLLGYPVAYRLTTARGRWRALLLICILMPFWTNLLVRAYGWMVILHPQGLINAALTSTGLIGNPIPLVHNTTGVVIGMTQVMLPYMVLPIAAVMEGMDPRLLQAASSLGAPPWRTFLHVFLPLTLPGVFAGVLLVFIISLGFFVIPALLGGTRDILVAQLIQFNISTVLNWGFAAALSTVLLTTTLVVYGLAHRWLRLGALWGQAR